MSEALIVRRGGAVSLRPKFTYNGTYNLLDDGDGNWRIKFLSSGTFIPSANMTVDAAVAAADRAACTAMAAVAAVMSRIKPDLR